MPLAFSSSLLRYQFRKTSFLLLPMSWNHSRCCHLVSALFSSFHDFLTSCSSSKLSTLPQSFLIFKTQILSGDTLKSLGCYFPVITCTHSFHVLCISLPVYILREDSFLCLECFPIKKERKKERKKTTGNDSQENHFEKASQTSLEASSVVSD